MNFYEFLFARIHNSLYQTNKSITEWSTIVSISILLFFNIFSILLYSNIKITPDDSDYFKFLILVIIGLNYFYFLYKNRYISLLEKYKENKKNLFLKNLLVLAYIFISTISFFKILGVNNKYTIVIVCVYGLIILNAYLKSRKNQKVKKSR
jgi:hypothetical protein